jgi:polysaccharide export outer membrane protein
MFFGQQLKFIVFRSILWLAFLVTVFLSSCIPQNKILLMQYDQLNDSAYANKFLGEEHPLTEYIIQPNDYLYVNITTIEKPLSDFLAPGGGLNFLDASNQALLGYHVSDDSTILFPYLGLIKVAGLTVRQSADEVKIAASKILGERLRVDVKLINNSVNIMGEVKSEGSFNMTKNKITIYEALTLAGGLTPYAKREYIKVFRKVGSENVVYLVDVLSGNLISGNMFYVFPNDQIYVDQMRAKSIGITPTFSLSVLMTLLTAYVLILSLTK